MNKNKILTLTVILLVVIGISMIYLGGFYATNIMLPPIFSGIGFILIAWALNALKNR